METWSQHMMWTSVMPEPPPSGTRYYLTLLESVSSSLEITRILYFPVLLDGSIAASSLGYTFPQHGCINVAKLFLYT